MVRNGSARLGYSHLLHEPHTLKAPFSRLIVSSNYFRPFRSTSSARSSSVQSWKESDSRSGVCSALSSIDQELQPCVSLPPRLHLRRPSSELQLQYSSPRMFISTNVHQRSSISTTRSSTECSSTASPMLTYLSEISRSTAY